MLHNIAHSLCQHAVVKGSDLGAAVAAAQVRDSDAAVASDFDKRVAKQTCQIRENGRAVLLLRLLLLLLQLLFCPLSLAMMS